MEDVRTMINRCHGDSSETVTPKASTTTTTKKTKKQAPQEIIDEFWTKFNTKTPGKGTQEAMKAACMCRRCRTNLYIHSNHDPSCRLLCQEGRRLYPEGDHNESIILSILRRSCSNMQAQGCQNCERVPAGKSKIQRSTFRYRV